jgi:hypothetical protein
VLPWETLRARDDRRARRRTNLAALEELEGRQLLSYSSLGYSLPDLRVSGLAGPVAAWGSTYQVTAILQNIGASTITEPLSLVPTTQVFPGPDGSPVPPYAIPSSADAVGSQVGIYLAPRPHSLAGAIKIGTTTAPALSQNNIERFGVSLTLPPRPTGFPATGVFYIRLLANSTHTVLESNYANNLSAPIPVRFLSQALPQLQATALDVPAVMQPKDTIAATVQIANTGTANFVPNAQDPIGIALVASLTPDLNLGVSFVDVQTLTKTIPAQSETPLLPLRKHYRSAILKAVRNNVNPNANVTTINFNTETLPVVPVYLGVAFYHLDPVTLEPTVPASGLELVRYVGPGTSGLPPTGDLPVSNPLTQKFPNPPDGITIGNVNPASL